jgi:hypothetical protein
MGAEKEDVTLLLFFFFFYVLLLHGMAWHGMAWCDVNVVVSCMAWHGGMAAMA